MLVGQKVIPWRHVTLTYVSDDQGQTWKASNLLDMETKDGGDHGGTMEGTVIELTDGRVYMLIRTTRGWFWEAYSSDGGQTWEGLAQSKIRSSTCCGQLARLASGRLALLWNRPTEENPRDMRSREELSLAFSDDDGKTWTRARRPCRNVRCCPENPTIWPASPIPISTNAARANAGSRPCREACG